MAFPNIQTAAGHLDRQDSAAAIPLLEELVDYFPGYAAAHLLLVRAYRMDGQNEAALRALAQVGRGASNPVATRRELQAIIDAQLQSVRPDSGSTTSDAPERPSGAPDMEATRPMEAPPPRSPRPQELEEDLRSRLGPPAETAEEDIKDLNSLIQKLKGARIQPEPDFTPDDVEEEEEVEDESSEAELVSETLARIYASQKEYRAAIQTYQQLAEQHPERSEEFLQKAREMEEKLG